MPYKITPIRNTDPKRYKVVNTDTREVKAKRTTLKKAKNQVRLLNGIERGMTVKGR